MTTWKTPSGWIVVRDALTMGPTTTRTTITPHTRPPADDDGDHMLVRTVECLDGRVEVELVCEPAFDYGARAGGVGARRRRAGTRPTRPAAGRRSGSSRTSRSASRATASARATCSRRASVPTARSRGRRASRPRQTSTKPQARIAATVRFWRAWLGRARIPDHRLRDPIQRSALAIKGLTYMPTGATVAALTTSLPETPGGERNWDYRYTWMRDTTFTLQALHWLNLDWEADEFMEFVADVEPTEDGSLQIMYGIDGRRDLTESTLDHLSGYAGARPVRIGNGAFDQRQNDVFGAVLDSILLHTRRSQRLPRRLWPIVESQAECATTVWREPDQGIWEARGAPQHYVSSKLMGWVALDRAAKLAEIRGDPDAGREVARDGGGDPRRHPRARRQRARACSASTTRPTRSTPRSLLAAIFGFLPGRRRAPARDGRRDRGGADRERLRPPLPHRRDRRRPLRQGGHVPDLLVLARLGARDRRRAAAGARPDGAAAADRVAARSLRRGVRRRHGPAPRQLPAGLLASRADRGGGAHHPPRDAQPVLSEKDPE